MVTPTGRQLCQGGGDLRVVLDIAGDPKGLFPLLQQLSLAIEYVLDVAVTVEMLPQPQHGPVQGRFTAHRDYLIHEANVPGLLGIDGATAQHDAKGFDNTPVSLSVLEFTGQALGAAVARQQIQIDLGLSEGSVVSGNHVGAGQQQFITAAKSRTIDGRHHRHVEAFDGCEGCLCGVGWGQCRGHVTRFTNFQQLLDVGTGNESAPGARDHQGIDIALVLDLVNDGVQFVQGTLIQGVNRGIVDEQQGHRLMVSEAMDFQSDIAPGLHNLPRLGQRAVVPPLGYGITNHVHDLWILQGRNVTQWRIQQQTPQGSAHVFARPGLGERGYHQKIRGHRCGAFLASHQPLQTGEVVITELAPRRRHQKGDRCFALFIVGCADDYYIAQGRIFPQGLVTENGALNFFGANAVSGHVDDIVGATVQGEPAVFMPTGVVPLGIAVSVCPTVEVDRLEAL